MILNMSVTDNSEEEKILKRWESRIQRGFLRIVCLRMYLRGEEMNGQELIERVIKTTHGRWKPSPGSVYPILGEMENEKIIELADKTSKKSKSYRITEFGRRAYKSLISNSPLYSQKSELNFDFLNSEDFLQSINDKYGSMEMRELKLHYELHKRIVTILGDLLQTRILEDSEI